MGLEQSLGFALDDSMTLGIKSYCLDQRNSVLRIEIYLYKEKFFLTEDPILSFEKLISTQRLQWEGLSDFNPIS